MSDTTEGVREAFALVDSLEALLLEACTAFERRGEPRVPMFREAEIQNEQGESQLGFVRDVSMSGIGLLHRGDLNHQDITVRVPLVDREVTLKAYLSWSRDCGQGWFLSGGTFTGAEAKG